MSHPFNVAVRLAAEAASDRERKHVSACPKCAKAKLRSQRCRLGQTYWVVRLEAEAAYQRHVDVRREKR